MLPPFDKGRDFYSLSSYFFDILRMEKSKKSHFYIPSLRLPPFTFAALGFCGGASASRKRVRSACIQSTKGWDF